MGVEKSKEPAGVLIDLIIQVAKQLQERGIDKEQAVVIAQETARFIAKHWNGSAVYFSAKKLGLRLLVAELTENFDGSRDNLVALARKHGISESHTYLLLNQVREQLKATSDQNSATKGKGIQHA